MKNIEIRDLAKIIPELNAGDKVLLSGVVYTARDAAHKRICGLIDLGSPLPFELKDSVIFYCGPCPAKPGDVIGSCGPTTSSRMDVYTPLLLSKGVRGLIGKGIRSQAVRDALKDSEAVYFAATGGVAALLSRQIKKAEIAAFPELGPEAVYRLEFSDFPLTVACDANGGDIYGISRKF